MNSGNFKFLEPSGTLQTCNVTALSLPLLISILCGDCVGAAYTAWWQYAWQITYHEGEVSPVHVMKAYVGVELYSHSFLIFGMQGVMIQIYSLSWPISTSHSRGATLYRKWGSADQVTNGIINYLSWDRKNWLFHGHKHQWPGKCLGFKVAVVLRQLKEHGPNTCNFLN